MLLACDLNSTKLNALLKLLISLGGMSFSLVSPKYNYITPPLLLLPFTFLSFSTDVKVRHVRSIILIYKAWGYAVEMLI
jgi:hypothetical protein